MTRLEFNNEVVAILAKDIYDYVYKERLETGDNQHIVCPCGVKKDCRITGYIDVAPYHTQFVIKVHQLVDCHEKHVMRIFGVVVILCIALRLGDVWAR